MKLTITEELALLKAEVEELRAVAAPNQKPRAHIKECLFYSAVAANDQVLVNGVWETVAEVDDSDENTMTLVFDSGLSMTWTRDHSILRRGAKSRIPKVPNKVKRTRSSR